jgi:hypothetical protein
MSRLRRAIGRFAVTWLLCQVTTLTLAPTALWVGSAAHQAECKCAHGDHAVCPMHHTPASDSTPCVMRSADHGDTAVLTSLLGSVGLLPVSTPSAQPESQRALVVADPATRSLRPAPPDSPPPRA